MVANIHAGPVIATQLMREAQQKEAVKPVDEGAAQMADADRVEDTNPAALQWKLAGMADDMASVATQFRNRREFENKNAVSGDGFDKVLEDEADAKAEKLVEVLAAQGGSLDALLAHARGLFPDDSDLYLVLKELLRRKQLSQLQRTRLEGLLSSVMQQADPKMLKGGIHCALKARLFGAALGLKATLLRQTYRRFLEGGRLPLEDYQDWIVSYGYKMRHIVLNFVEESLSTDIRAEDPSCSHLEFGNLLAHMHALKMLRTADYEFIKRLMSRRLVTAYEDEEADWLLLLCALIRQDLPSADLLTEMMEAARLSTHAQRSVWLNAVRSACKHLPQELLDQRGGPASFVTVLATIDQLIDTSYAAEMLEQRGIKE